MSKINAVQLNEDSYYIINHNTNSENCFTGKTINTEEFFNLLLVSCEGKNVVSLNELLSLFNNDLIPINYDTFIERLCGYIIIQKILDESTI